MKRKKVKDDMFQDGMERYKTELFIDISDFILFFSVGGRS
jgi:hypothetical protein